MARDDSDDIHIRPGRSRGGGRRANPRDLPFTRQVELAVREAGGNPGRIGGRKGGGSGRFNAHGRWSFGTTSSLECYWTAERCCAIASGQRMDLRSFDQPLDAACAMNDNQSSNSTAIKRINLGFKEEASCAFSFLKEMGFAQVESSPTIVAYERDDLLANIHHARQSYEVEFEIIRAGTVYSLSELIRLAAPAEGEAYRNSIATTPTAVHDGICRVRDLVKRYAGSALRGVSETFVSLDHQRREWAKALGLKTQAASLKPKAEEAFRLGNYAEAARMYEQIRPALSPTEIRIAELARERAAIAR